MASLRRVLALWALHARLDLIFVARGARELVTFYVSDLLVGLGSVATVFLLAERFDGIGPWSRGQVLFLLGYALTVGGLVGVLFGMNVAAISRKIGRGQLDHLLVQPQPLWMSLLTEGFLPFTGVGMIAPGLLLLGWWSGELAVSPLWLLPNLAGSVTIVMAFAYAVGSLAFWAPRAAEEVNSATTHLVGQLKGFPLDAAGPLVTGGLLTVLPIGFAAWYPSRALIGLDAAGHALLVTPLAAVLAGGLAAWVFGKGLRHYGRTGSGRYLAHGHRR